MYIYMYVCMYVSRKRTSSPRFEFRRWKPPCFCFSQTLSAVRMKASIIYGRINGYQTNCIHRLGCVPSTPSALLAEASTYSRPLSSANACASARCTTRLFVRGHKFNSFETIPPYIHSHIADVINFCNFHQWSLTTY